MQKKFGLTLAKIERMSLRYCRLILVLLITFGWFTQISNWISSWFNPKKTVISENNGDTKTETSVDNAPETTNFLVRIWKYIKDFWNTSADNNSSNEDVSEASSEAEFDDVADDSDGAVINTEAIDQNNGEILNGAVINAEAIDQNNLGIPDVVLETNKHVNYKSPFAFTNLDDNFYELRKSFSVIQLRRIEQDVAIGIEHGFSDAKIKQLVCDHISSAAITDNVLHMYVDEIFAHIDMQNPFFNYPRRNNIMQQLMTGWENATVAVPFERCYMPDQYLLNLLIEDCMENHLSPPRIIFMARLECNFEGVPPAAIRNYVLNYLEKKNYDSTQYPQFDEPLDNCILTYQELCRAITELVHQGWDKENIYAYVNDLVYYGSIMPKSQRKLIVNGCFEDYEKSLSLPVNMTSVAPEDDFNDMPLPVSSIPLSPPSPLPIQPPMIQDNDSTVNPGKTLAIKGPEDTNNNYLADDFLPKNPSYDPTHSLLQEQCLITLRNPIELPQTKLPPNFLDLISELSRSYSHDSLSFEAQEQTHLFNNILSQTHSFPSQPISTPDAFNLECAPPGFFVLLKEMQPLFIPTLMLSYYGLILFIFYIYWKQWGLLFKADCIGQWREKKVVYLQRWHRLKVFIYGVNYVNSQKTFKFTWPTSKR